MNILQTSGTTRNTQNTAAEICMLG